MNLLETATKIGVEGFLHPDEFEKLVELAVNREVLEIGSFKGLSAWGMAIVAKSVCCVDTFKANSAGQQQMKELTTYQDFTNATWRFTNVARFVGTSEEAWPFVPGDFDMIFLDAMHTRIDVQEDIRRWWPRLRIGGVFVMHDYRHSDFPGVEQAADEAFGPAPDGTTIGTLRWIHKTK